MPTCNRWTWETLGSQPIMPKNLLGPCSKQLALTYQDKSKFARDAASHGCTLGAHMNERTLLNNVIYSQQRKSD
jgi:hypothetical protein